MQCLEARLASFSAVTKPKRSAKVAFPLDPKIYPNLTPESLANAGFYHTPGKASEVDTHDTCRCFHCGLVLGGWDEDDDPNAEHVKRDGECAWKEVMCRVEVDRANGGEGRLRKLFPTAEALPNSDRSTAFRERTFGEWWPHETPSAHELAQAGFVSMPSQSAPDGTMCPLCRYEVEEWEENDDPWLIHNKKEPECPFFTATVEGGKKPAKSRAKTAAAAKPTRATRANTATLEAEPTEPEREKAEEDMSIIEIPAPAPKRRGRPPKASTAAKAPASTSTKTASTSTRGRKKAENDVEEDEQEPEPQAARTTRSRSGSKAPAVQSAQVPSVEAVAEEEEPKGRKTKPLPRKGKGRATTTTAEEPVTEPSRMTRSAPTRKLAIESPAPTPPPKQQPLSELDRFMNVPPPPSPTVREAVVSMIRSAYPDASVPSTFSEEQKKMTLEEYVRQQYRVQHDELRAEGEAKIQAWETRTTEARTRLERV